jgi:hypothetical protein
MNDSDDIKKPILEAPVADVLISVSNEVRMLSDAAGDLQNLIGNLLVAGAVGGSQSVYELQSLDRFCQNLGAVADFLQGLSKNVSPTWKVDTANMVAAVKLADVAERLAGRKSELQDSTGEFEDFDAWPMTA